MSELSKSLLERLNEVRKQVTYVQKDAQVQNYLAVTHDMVTAAIRPALVEQEIFFLPSIRSEEVREAGTTKNGTPMFRYEAVFEITVMAPGAEPAEGIKINIPAHGQDMADKAPSKALSMAVKSAQLKLLNLETGENEEGRFEEPTKINDQQTATIKTLLEETKSDKSKFMAWLKITDIDQINAAAYDQIIKTLERKR